MTAPTRRLPHPVVVAAMLPLLLLWPLPLVWRRAVVGDEQSEAAAHLWGWWAGWQEGSLLSVHSSLLNFPDGIQLQLIDPFNALIWRVGASLGPAAGYNLVLVVGVLVAGLAGWRLAVETGADRGGQLLGVTVAASCPTLLGVGVDGITEGLGVGWVGLQLALLLSLRRGATPGRLALLALAMAAGVYSGPYNGIWMAALDIPVGLWLVRHTRRHLAAGAVAVALCLPFAWSLADKPADEPGGAARTAAELPPQRPDWRGAWRDGADVLDLCVPARFTGQPARVPTTGYLGVVTLVLAAVGSRRRASWPWLAGAALFVAVALGPWISVGGEPIALGAGHLAGPAGWLEKLGPLGRMTRWYRAAAVAVFLLVPVATRAVAGRRAVLAAALVLLDARLGSPAPFPLPVLDVHASPALAAADGPVAEIPPRHDGQNPGEPLNENLLYQTFHGQPSSGILNNPGPDAMANSWWLRSIVRELRTGGAAEQGANVERAREELWKLGYRWLAVYPDRLGDPPLAPVERVLGPPLARDDRVVLFKLR